MYRFFVSPDQVNTDFIHIIGPDVNHMKNVLRLKVGDEVTISDGQEKDYCCIIKSIIDNLIVVNILKMSSHSNELNINIVLFQGLPKKDKMEWIVQKAVELGIHEIIPVKMKRSIVKLDEKAAVKKKERWQGIATSAAKQSKRSVIPEVTLPMTFKETLSKLESMDLVLVPYENARGITYTRSILSELGSYATIGIVIGPEGGFDEEEISQLELMEAKIISLGKRILRTETAGMALLAYMMLQIEEDNNGN
jgi:16S rRNA (uracil1498-N3)-methyltransferase